MQLIKTGGAPAAGGVAAGAAEAGGGNTGAAGGSGGGRCRPNPLGRGGWAPQEGINQAFSNVKPYWLRPR